VSEGGRETLLGNGVHALLPPDAPSARCWSGSVCAHVYAAGGEREREREGERGREEEREGGKEGERKRERARARERETSLGINVHSVCTRACRGWSLRRGHSTFDIIWLAAHVQDQSFPSSPNTNTMEM